MSIIKDYKVSFFKREILGSPVLGMLSVNGYLSQYISEANNIKDADSTINAIKSVLDGEIEKIESTLNSMVTISMDINTTKIYDDPIYDVHTMHFSLPTIHFKELALAWRDFLLSQGK